MINEAKQHRGHAGLRNYPDFHGIFQECIELYVAISLLICLSIKSNFTGFCSFLLMMIQFPLFFFGKRFLIAVLFDYFLIEVAHVR